jgi:hypothetical protein
MPSSQATAAYLATYEDILALAEHLVGEILQGALYSHPRPAPKHARAYSCVAQPPFEATQFSLSNL